MTALCSPKCGECKLALAYFIMHTLRSLSAQRAICCFWVYIFPIPHAQGAEWLLRSPESLLSFKCVFLSLLSALLLSVLFTLMPVVFFVQIISDLSNILLRRLTLGEKCGMLHIKAVPPRFQIVGLIQKVKHCRQFAVNSIFLNMLPDVLDRFLVVLDSGSIFLFETALRPT